jgi:hypothetical protein
LGFTPLKDISFFKHYREVEQRNGESVMKFAPMKKTIYSLGVLRILLGAANRRYLEFLSVIDDPQQWHRQAQQNLANGPRGSAVLSRVQLLRPGR